MNEMNRFYSGARVLVTGHTGFKGSWLTEWLLRMGAQVTGFSLPPVTEPAHFDQLELAGRCDHRIGDIRDREAVRRLVRDTRPDVLFHLAAQPLVRTSYEQPVETHETNIMGTAHILDALRGVDGRCAAVIITTDKVYENREWLHAYRENDPLGGYDPYSASKAGAELVIQSYRQSFFNPRDPAVRIAVASARSGNVIGGGDWAVDRIVPDSIRSLLRGEAVPVRNPVATRPWQHVLEPLGGYLLLAMRQHEALARGAVDERATLCGAFNFGPDPTSNRPVRDLVERIAKTWPGRWESKPDPRAPHEAGLLNLAVEKAYHVLGWRPRWNFEQAVDRTVQWYRDTDGGRVRVRECTDRQIDEYIQPA